MVRVISQETFDSVVSENMDDFGMEREEAVNEAKEQFQKQGVSLSNIVFSEKLDASEDHAIVNALAAIKNLASREPPLDDTESLARECTIVASECSKDLAQRVLATSKQGYETLVEALTKTTTKEGKICTLKALTALLDGNPDPLDAEGSAQMVLCLHSEEEGVACAAMDCLLQCCVRHEANRVNLVKCGLLSHLDKHFDSHPVHVSRIWMALVQDDDVRVPFGEAHNHARAVVEEHEGLSRLSKGIMDNASMPTKDLMVLLACLSAISVRNEYCQAVLKDGVLKAILQLLLEPDQAREITRESLKLVKTLAGNDNVKKDIGASNGIPVIVSAMLKHLKAKSVCVQGCQAISSVVLRHPDNAKQVMDAGGAQLLTQVLKLHMDSKEVVSSCASAIRCIVGRTPALSAQFIELDVEKLLNEAKEAQPGAAEPIKCALRDMDLKVHMEEQWTGEKGEISR